MSPGIFHRSGRWPAARARRERVPTGPWAAAAGFTLVEVLITVALLAVALGLLFVPMMSTFGYFRTGTAKADAYSAARMALDAICRELQEAMYVQLDMYDNSMVAFVPPLRVNPEDPSSEIVTPPRPDWSRAIRLWRALHDPSVDYNPTGRLGPANTYYVARTVVEDPFNITDAWNRWNRDWAADQSASAAGGITNWAPIPRVVNADIDWFQDGLRKATLQPGYPYLAVRHRLLQGQMDLAQAARTYRNLVVALTPNALDYDVTDLQFQPLVVSGEWLTPVGGSEGDDYSVYRTRYPLLRLGAPYTGWSALAGGLGQDPVPVPTAVRAWARDPFLLIYRFDPTTQAYTLRAVGCFDPRSRTMRVLSDNNGDGVCETPIYDTGTYPHRLPPTAPGAPWLAFGTGADGWIEGTFRFDFPPPASLPAGTQTLLHTADEMAEGKPMYVAGTRLTEQVLASGGRVFEVPLMTIWEQRSGGQPLAYFLVPDSVRVRVDTNGDGRPDRALTQVYCTPRSGLDQFQVGLDPAAAGGSDPAGPKYGYLRLPERLADGRRADEHQHYWVDFRWRSNGVWVNGREFPDLICGYYRSAAVLEVSITVTRADPGARPEQRVAQTARLTRRVKLRNALREISYGK